MKKMDYQNVKGTQDYLPEAEMIRSRVRRTLEKVFEKYGCQPLETPILNYKSLLASKYGGGAEILEEMYTLSDRGERALALRYDLTIPFAKVVAINPAIRMPFKRYEIGKVFRDGPIKAGRFREFTQCDVDIVGVRSQVAEADLMMMAIDVFAELEMDVTIQYNNRKLLTGMLRMLGIRDGKLAAAILILDKIEKIGMEGVTSELTSLELPWKTVVAIKQFLSNTINTDLSFFDSFVNEDKEIKEGLAELRELEEFLDYLGMKAKCVFNPFLARGLEIYTGTIYEIFLNDKTINSSIGSGGRYDNSIGGLIGTGECYSTVGISFGLDVIYTALEKGGAEKVVNSPVDYYIIPLNTLKQSLLVAGEFRKKGNKVEVEMGNKKLRKAMDKANKENIKKVIIIGEEEVARNEILIKDMETGEEEAVMVKF